MIFARTADDDLASLVKQIDALAAVNKDKKMSALVNFLGDDPETLKKTATEFGEKHKIEHSALVVPTKDHASGPKKYDIPDDAHVTVLLYHKKKVAHAHAHAFNDGGLGEAQIAAVINDAKKMLAEAGAGKDKKKGKKKDDKKNKKKAA